MKEKILLAAVVAFLFSSITLFAGDPPHNSASDVNCSDCHGATLLSSQSPFWTDNTDDAAYCAVCLRCHTLGNVSPYNNSNAPPVTTHETIKCTTCHHNHDQDQIYSGKNNRSDFFLAEGAAISAVYDSGSDTTTITYSSLAATAPGSYWGADITLLAEKTDSGRGALLIPDRTSRKRWPLYIIVAIDDPAPNTIRVKGNASTATNIAITYGQLIRGRVQYDPVHSSPRSVQFYDREGAYAFAHNDQAVDIAPPDGIQDDSTPDSICQICHTSTNHWRNDGTKSEDHFSGYNCTKNCHKHTSNFRHGGNGGGENCIDCHNSGSHIIHLDTNDPRGPAVTCDECHDFNNMPKFKNQDESGNHLLPATDICDACHSPAGTYDGIDDADVGARNNWDNGIYEQDKATLKPGKEKWCATCHDEVASLIQTVAAPNIVGDEDGDYIYGTGWGYYKTGHGLVAGEQYPSKGGVETLSGRPVECDSCHDYTTVHIDGEPRTYDDGDVTGLDPAIYRQGYRLKMINGLEPLLMPRPANTGNNADQFSVCLQVGCHDSGPFTDSADMNTNLVTDGVNRHAYHLNSNNQAIIAADWSGAYNSRMTCIVCHNVHGSTRLAMVRDGKLIGREPGQQIWYKNDAATYIVPISSNPPIPEDLPLSASDGTAWIGASAANLCAHCHPINGFTGAEDRAPFQDVARAPVLEWTGANGLVSDGVVPDSASGHSTFTFQVSYGDINNDSPNPIEVWVDLNDKDGYEAGEKYAMAGTEALDTNLVNGKTYTKSLAIAKAGDNVLNYRFYATDGTLEATGPPTIDSTVTILNNPPILTWTEESYFETDGVHPNIGGNDADYQFRVTYTDADGECPPAATDIQVVVGGTPYNLDNNDGAGCDVGRIYYTTLQLTTTGDHAYYFTATDGADDATGSPTSNSTVTVQAGANSPPSLDWVIESCLTDGVKPVIGLATGDFEFKVRYTDPEGTTPSSIKVWVDLNDDDIVDTGEEQTLTWVDDGNEDYTDGEIFTYAWAIGETDAGDHGFSFSASDGADAALGEPTEASPTRTVSVVSTTTARGVRQGLGDAGPTWYDTIQSAVDAVNNAHTVLVYEGTYNEDVVFDRTNDNATTLRSVCGPDTTIINGSGSTSTITFTRNTGNLLDGFQVTGGTTGIFVEGAQTTINDCQVHGNSNGFGGIYVAQSGDMPRLTLTNSDIYDNTSDRGGGVRISRGTGHTISNSTIRNNTATGDSIVDGGGGLHVFQAGTLIISNSVIRDNTTNAGYPGGGIYVAQVTELTVSDSIIRDNVSSGGGGGVFNSDSTISFIRSRITTNTAAEYGGAIRHPSAGSNVSFENCIVADNRATQGGMAFVNGGNFDIINSTIANNQATAGNSGMIYNQLATITIRNSILWGNRAATVGHIAKFNGGSMTITDSIIQSGDDGNFTNAPFFTGNVTPVVSGFASEDDPWFVGNGDYHIQAFSPAIDNGSAVYAPDLDIDSQNRPQGAADDIGADEYTP